MKLKSLYLLALVLVVVGCSSSKKTTETVSSGKTESVAIKDNLKKVTVVDTFDKYNNRGSFKIGSTAVINNSIEVEVTYSGGCAQHNFTLYSTENYQKSLPPKLSLLLVHDNGGDACREQITETILFNIESTQYEGIKTVLLIVNQDFQVEYNY